MHRMLMSELATARHTELVRVAEQRRRVALFAVSRPRPVVATARISRALDRLRRPAVSTWSAADVCCA